MLRKNTFSVYILVGLFVCSMISGATAATLSSDDTIKYTDPNELITVHLGQIFSITTNTEDWPTYDMNSLKQTGWSFIDNPPICTVNLKGKITGSFTIQMSGLTFHINIIP